MNRIFFFIIFILSISSCQNEYDFWSIDHFNLVDDALYDNESVRVLYYCAGPHDDQINKGFYRHAVVISTETKDTVNVLTFPNPDLDRLTPTNNVLVYNDHPVLEKMISKLDELPDEMKRTIENIDTNKVSWPEYSLVARDPDFDYIADNNYETVIGSLTKK